MKDLTAFWDVDTQVDFIRPEGKLYAPGAETIVPNLKRLTDFARDRGILNVASTDAHQPGDAEFAQYPPHCLAGTAGQQKIPETRLPNALVIPNRPVQLAKDLSEHAQVVLEKQHFDVFTNPNTEALLAGIAPRRGIVLYGLVTEICVACAARGLLQRGYRLTVVTDAIRHLDEAKAHSLLDEVRAGGGSLLTTEQVFSSLISS